MPERSPFSCPPPASSGVSFTPLRTYNAPTPFGPCSLWAESDSKSIGSDRTSSGILPAACTASVWNKMPFGGATLASSATGWSVPSTLLAAMTETSRVSGRMARSNSAGSTMPSPLTGNSVTVTPNRRSPLQHSNTAGMLDRTGDDVARAGSPRPTRRPRAPCCRPRCRCR